MLRGTRAELVIKQGAEQNYQPTLYVRNLSTRSAADFEHALRGAVMKLCKTWPGLELKSSGDAWEIIVPDKYALGHEAHFSQVTENFLQYLKIGKLPAWEVPNMLSKYYITTEAYRLSRAKR
jgi:hypothetical protein